MSTLPPRLDLLLGPEQAAAFITDQAAELARLDHLPAPTALRLACERASSGDPLLLAAAGQTWTLRPDTDIDDAPAHRLHIHARLTCPPRVLVSDPDDLSGQIDELLIEVLDLYHLHTWPTADHTVDTSQEH
ncbi:hypothetical protein ACX6XY_15030 [Streptomyces sp. O3]